MDSSASLEQLKDTIRRFCEERDWDQFHSPKELAIGTVTEAAELLAEFRFLSEAQMRDALATPEKRAQIEDEVADVLFFILRFAQMYDVDLDEALRRKLVDNKRRYPIDKARGRNLKHRDL